MVIENTRLETVMMAEASVESRFLASSPLPL